MVRAQNGWLKSHGLGNDYIVFNTKNISFKFTEEMIRKICNRNYGIGSDGILVSVDSGKADFGLKIFNPDGSEAEKSGNGIRIFADYLYSMNFTDKKKFSIEVGGSLVKCEIYKKRGKNEVKSISVEMGKASFTPDSIPVKFNGEETIDMSIFVEGRELIFSAVSIGNPHAVFMVDNLDSIDVKKIGPLIENNSMFPNRINVQFVQIIDRKNIMIEIWERGAGYTQASGSSSCGAVSVLNRKDLVDNNVNVHMPGGTLEVSIDKNNKIRLKGPVTRVACGILLI
ncbi:MAG: diaminopimelate epimerase [Actinomycetota bacterium]|nr:MAG: diaminopimelate epimerase [Actinomycetota bacterium]